MNDFLQQSENIRPLPTDAKTTESFKAELDKRREALVEKLNTLRSEKVSMGSNGLESQGVTGMERLIQAQIAEIDKLRQRSQEAFTTRIKSANAGLRDRIADEVLKEFNQDGHAKVDQFLRTVDRKTDGGLVSPWDVAEIEKAVYAAAKIDMQNPEMGKTWEKVLNKVRNNNELNDADYQAIIGLLNPVGLHKSSADIKAGFEATTAGSMLSYMRPDQRFALVEHFMSTPDKKAGTADLIESFLSMGFYSLSNRNKSKRTGRKFVRASLDQKVITQAEYDTRFKPNFENNQYQKDEAAMRKIIRR